MKSITIQFSSLTNKAIATIVGNNGVAVTPLSMDWSTVFMTIFP